MPKLKKINLKLNGSHPTKRDWNSCWNPQIRVGQTFLAKVAGEWVSGKIVSDWFGYQLEHMGGWRGNWTQLDDQDLKSLYIITGK